MTPARSERSHRWPRMVLSLVPALVLSACVTEGDIGPNILLLLENDLGQTVEVSYVQDGVAERLGRIEPGDELAVRITGPLGGLDEERGLPCTVVELVAQSEDGVTLARLPPPVCTGSIGLLSNYAED